MVSSNVISETLTYKLLTIVLIFTSIVFAKKYLIGIIIINNNTGLSKQLLAAYKISYKKKYYATITMDGNFKDDPKKISIFIYIYTIIAH